MTSLVAHALNGLSFGSLLFLLASGLTLAFGLMRVLNLAHGAFYLLGGYLSLDLLARTGSYWLAMAGAVAAVGLLGVGFERLLVQRVRHEELAQVVLTVGAAFLIADQILAHYGGRPVAPPRPPGLEGTVSVAQITFPTFRLALIVVAAVVFALLWVLINRTTVGASLRAAVDDEQMARASGIRVPALFMAVFGAGSALAAFGGVLGGAFTGLDPGGEFSILLLALVVVVVGGLGSVSGAFVAALLVGLVDEFGKWLFPSFALFTLYAPVALLLAWRPTGLFGRSGTGR